MITKENKKLTYFKTYKLKIRHNQKLEYKFENSRLIVSQNGTKLMECYYKPRGFYGFPEVIYGCKRFYKDETQSGGCSTFNGLIKFAESDLGRKIDKTIIEKFEAVITMQKLENESEKDI